MSKDKNVTPEKIIHMDICSYAMKKNTLLYLDSNLVETAKRHNVNISKLTEDALKEALQTIAPLNAHEYVIRVLEEANYNRYYESYLLPFAIESMKLRNVGPFTEFEASFQRNGPNIIVGPGGSGKSFILNSILLVFGKQRQSFERTINIRASGKAEVMVTLFRDQYLSTITINKKDELDPTKGYKCLLLDDAFFNVPEDMIRQILNELQRLGLQTIMATSRLIDPSKLPEGTNIILLKRLSSAGKL